jgi:hypothetical protein
MNEVENKPTAEDIKKVREYIRKNGKVHDWKLAPLVFHDNRGKGSYNVGRNARKRLKKLNKGK